MWKNYVRRLIASVFVLIGVVIISFCLMRLGGGDPAAMMAGPTATLEEVEEYRERMGLNKSYVEQFFIYVSGLLKGDLGFSYNYNMDVTKLLASRLPNTLKLNIVAMIWSYGFAIIFGITASVNQGKPIDVAASITAMLGQSVSTVWLGFLLILILAVNLKWLPTQGMGTWKHYVMPCLCAGFGHFAGTTRMTRSAMVDVLREDHITATRARGVNKFTTYTKYAFKNASIPLLTSLGGRIGAMLAGSTVIENIFNWPGMGSLMVQGVGMRDYQLVQSILLMSATMLVIGNIITDILYTLVDPRISFN